MFKMQGLVPQGTFVNLFLRGELNLEPFFTVRPHLMVQHVSKIFIFETIYNYRKCKWKFRKTKRISDWKRHKTSWISVGI